MLYFFNQDIKIIKIFCQCLTKIYNYSNIIPIFITYNKNDLQSINTVEHLKKEFNDNNVYKIYFINDSNRKNPIIRVKAGGKNLAYLFIENAYRILHFK